MRKWYTGAKAGLDPAILLIVGLALLVRMVTLWHYGLSLTLHSDDDGYTRSAVWLLQTGTLSYYQSGVPTVHMMPGISWLLAGVFAVFGTGGTGVYAAKVVMLLIGGLGVYATYRLGTAVWCRPVGWIAALAVALYPPIILTDTLLLTETPFMTAFLFLLVFTIEAAHTRRLRSVVGATLMYVVCLLFRPTVAMFPIVILLYLLVKRYPLQLLIRHTAISAGITILCMCPWWIRNAIDFHQFIPLSGGSGDPLLLGTFQGHGAPPGTYDSTLKAIKSAHPGITPNQLMNAEQAAAMQRIHTWMTGNRTSFLKTYLYTKPRILWSSPFYWKEILHVKKQTLQFWQPRLVAISLVGYVVGLAAAWSRKWELLLLGVSCLYYTVIYSVYFAYSRYSEPFLPIVFIGMGLLVTALVKTVWRRKNPS